MYYAISGRVIGDDEDQTRLIEAATTTEARQAFIDALQEPDCEVTITSVVSSETPITKE